MPDCEREFIALGLVNFRLCILVKLVFNFWKVGALEGEVQWMQKKAQLPLLSENEGFLAGFVVQGLMFVIEVGISIVEEAQAD